MSRPEATFPILLMSVGYLHFTLALATHAKTNVSLGLPAWSQLEVVSLFYQTMLNWKSLASCLLRSGAVGALGKVWFPDRTGFLDLLVTFPPKVRTAEWWELQRLYSLFY